MVRSFSPSSSTSRAWPPPQSQTPANAALTSDFVFTGSVAAGRSVTRRQSIKRRVIDLAVLSTLVGVSNPGRQDIAAGQELTVDYRTLIDDTDLGVYRDASSGQEIRGFSARQTLLQTARELISILEADPDWQG